MQFFCCFLWCFICLLRHLPHRQQCGHICASSAITSFHIMFLSSLLPLASPGRCYFLNNIQTILFLHLPPRSSFIRSVCWRRFSNTALELRVKHPRELHKYLLLNRNNAKVGTDSGCSEQCKCYSEGGRELRTDQTASKNDRFNRNKIAIRSKRTSNQALGNRAREQGFPSLVLWSSMKRHFLKRLRRRVES